MRLLGKEVETSGVTTESFYDEHTDTLTINRTQDCEPFVEQAKQQGEYWNSRGALLKNDLVPAAEYPPVIVELYCRKNGISFNEFIVDRKHVRNMLVDPDLSKFRIWKGKV